MKGLAIFAEVAKGVAAAALLAGNGFPAFELEVAKGVFDAGNEEEVKVVVEEVPNAGAAEGKGVEKTFDVDGGGGGGTEVVKPPKLDDWGF